jgi:tetratricopeptide (TPR) repeat protein
MAVPREDLLLMTRALKRGLADVKAIRKALDRQVSKPVGFLEALHLGATEVQTLRGDTSLPDPASDRAQLDLLRSMLLDTEHLSPAEWERFIASLTRPSQRAGYAALPVPHEFGGYSLQWELARRERGVVYRARDREGRDVAIKVFRKEIPIPGELPRIDGLAYAVMPFIEGESIEAKRPASSKRAVQAVETAAHLLRSVAHGALSPARILVRKNDSVVVVGFEHARAVALSPRARAYSGEGNPDVHALAAILYELLTGSPPAGETSPAARSRDVDADLDRVVSFALRGGYGTMGDFADDLRRYLAGQPVTARSATAASAGKKKPWGVMAAAASVAIAAIVAVVVLSMRGKQPGAPKPGPVEEPRTAVQKPAPPPEPARPAPKPRVEVSKPAEPPKPMTPEDEQRLADTSLQAVTAGDWNAVIAIGNEAVSRGSKKDWAPYHLATAYGERNELDKALEYVTRALQLKPDSRDSLELRAQILTLRGEARKALAELEAFHGKKASEYNTQIKRLNSQKSDERTLLQRGVYYCLKRHFDSAEKDFTAALELGLKSALVWRALARKAQENRPGAEADAKAYLAEMPAGYAAEDAKAILADLK